MGLLRDARVFIRQLETSPRNQQENEQVEPEAFPDSGVGDCFSRCFSFQGCTVLYKYQKFITESLRWCNVAMENLHSSWQIDGGKSLLTSWDGWNTSHYPYQLGTIRLLDLDGWYYPKFLCAGRHWMVFKKWILWLRRQLPKIKRSLPESNVVFFVCDRCI